MAAVVKTYIVVSSLPVVIEDSGVSLSYQPGAIFQAKTTNPSVIRLLADGSIVETTGSVDQGFAVIQGQQGPVGPQGPTGPQGPPGGLPAALAIDNSTAGNDIEVTDTDNIVGQSDGGWYIGSPDGGTTPLRPFTVFVQNSIDISDTTLSSGGLAGAGAFLVTSGADFGLTLRGADATPTSGNDGGTVVVQAGAKDGAGVDGKIELRGNFTNPLVADIDGALNLYDASANKVIEVLADPGALRVGRNTQLTAAEGDFVFGNDGTIAGTPTGLILWDASVQELGIRDAGNNRTIDIDGSVPEVVLYDSGIRGGQLAVLGGVVTFKAEDASNRTGTDTVLDLSIRGGEGAGVENGGNITIDAGRAVGTGLDGSIQFRTGNMDRWFFDLNGQLLANTDNGYNIGAVGANRPNSVYVGTQIVVGSTITVTTDTITASGAFNLSVDGALSASAPASTAGAGAAWSWSLQSGEVAVAGVAPTTGFAGGAWVVTGGAGGAAQGTDVGGETGGDAGVGGTVQLAGGTGGGGSAGTVDPGQPAAGGPLWLFGGAGGAGAGTSDNADGADVVIRGGAAGTGGSGLAAVAGDVVIGDLDTANVTCGALSVTNTSLIGSITTVNGGVSIGFETGGSAKWSIPAAGHLLAGAVDSYDIGSTTPAERPRDVHINRELNIASSAHVLNATQAGFFGATPVAQQSDTVALTDNSGGTADDTIAAITQAANAGSADVGPVADAIADLTAKYNSLRDLLRAYGLMT